jgi:integrase
LLCIFNRLSSISRVYGNPYVFPGTKKGLPIAPPRLAFNLIKERSGIPRPHGVVLHIARHSVTSKLISYDVDISSVQKLLNHKSIESTLRYAKLSEGKQRETSDGLSALVERLPVIN